MTRHLVYSVGLLWTALTAAAIQDANPLSRYYGFGSLEILKSDPGIHSLTVSDFNGDGLNDARSEERRVG